MSVEISKIVKRMAELRQEAGLTPSDLSRMVNNVRKHSQLNKGYIGRIERGLNSPGIRYVEEFLDVLGYKLEVVSK